MSEKVMSTVSYVGAAASVGAGLTLTEWGIIVGIGTALLTFVANIIWQVRKDRRDQRIHDLEVQRLCRKYEGMPGLPSCEPSGE